jgi:hypothetical protein
VKKILLIALLWRILLFIPIILGYLLLPYREGFSYTSISHFTESYNPILHFLLSPWANFDGVHYLLIAGNGYTNNGAFFPLFPLTIYLLTSLFGTIQAFGPVQYFSGLFLSNVYFLLALVVLYKLLKFDYKDNVVFRTILLLLVFPTSFFFVSIYTESLFLLLALLSFYFIRKGNYWRAGLFGALLTATKFVGIAILPALILEFLIREKIVNPKLFKQKLLRLLPILLAPVGLISYMYYNSLKWGDSFFFVKAQEEFANNRTSSSIILFPQTIIRYFKIFFTVSPNQFEFWVALLELSTFIFASIMLYVAYKKGVRITYLLFAALAFLIPASTGTFTSIPRYILIMFPIFIALALIQNNRFKLIYGVVCVILLFLLLMLFSRGYFVS